MSEELKLLANRPVLGFYYHYKHDPNGPVNNYAYEVVGIGHHTEEEGSLFVVYRPLYEAFVYKLGKCFDIRPLDMFMETVKIDNVERPRFQRITDPAILQKLRAYRRSMYPREH